MSESPLFKARQAELAKRGATAVKHVSLSVEEQASFAAAEEEAIQAKIKAEQEEAKKTKKKPEPVVEAPKEVFPPVLENKAIQPEEVKEEIKEDDEML
jgi:hypothetical protein